MKCRGGLSVPLAGRPAGSVETPPAAKALYIPLASRRLAFSQLRVEAGQAVEAGQVLAVDDANHAVPLLAPAAATVRLGTPGHIVLDDVDISKPVAANPTGAGTDTLLALGAWQFFADAHTGAVPDPTVPPVAVIVSTVHSEPFVTRGDVHLRGRLDAFLRGMTCLQSLLEYQPIYLVIPDIQSQFARQVKDQLRGIAWINVETVPLRYGCEHVSVLARRLGRRPSAGEAVWCVDTAGVFAVDRAMTAGEPTLTRTISLAGPCVDEPMHLEVPVGYPLADLLAGRVSPEVAECRVIAGGVLTGLEIGAGEDVPKGVDAECVGVTVLQEATRREFLGWLNPGFDRRSYSACYGSTLRAAFAEPMTTALRGEVRPCVSCNFCEEVCPAGIMPHVIHKYLYQDLLEDVEAAGVDLCIECGLCSYVCPSKIELRSEMIDGKRIVADELHGEEASQ